MFAELDAGFGKFEWILVIVKYVYGGFNLRLWIHTVANASTAPAKPPASNETIGGVEESYTRLALLHRSKGLQL